MLFDVLIGWLRAVVAVGLCLSLCVIGGPASAEDEYGFPIADRWVATVVGTPSTHRARFSDDVPFRKRRVTVIDNRKLPDALWYNRDMLYTVALQPQDDAPVLFLIAGTGSAHNGAKNLFIGRAFYAAGYHIVSLSSPTYPNFVASASRTGVPGHVYRDAKDIYRAMQVAWKAAKGSRRATGFSLVGYSLGAFNAAFVAHLDQTQRQFDFERVLMINPPVNLYNSMSLLDRMIENIPGGEDNFVQYFNKIMHVFSDVYKREQDAVTFGENFLVKVFRAYQPKDEELAALIGLSFRLSSGSMIFTSDVMTDFGFIKPRDYQLSRYENLDRFRMTAYRVGFTDYYHEFFYPFYADEYPGLSRDGFIDAMSLTAISDYLRAAEHIQVMHNADDIILETDEIDIFRDLFGDRVKIFPRGGHIGNLEYTENAAHMLKVMKP